MSFCFLHDLIIKEDSSVKCKQAPLSPRLHKPILDILPIYINIFCEKLPQPNHALNLVSRLLHPPKYQLFSTESNMMFKVV